jgi:hypothetical protein
MKRMLTEHEAALVERKEKRVARLLAGAAEHNADAEKGDAERQRRGGGQRMEAQSGAI